MILNLLRNVKKRILSATLSETDNFLKLSNILGYKFENPELLRQALTHRSLLQETNSENVKANEQMEFLGDAVLELVVVDDLFHRFPEKTEGDLSKLKSVLVSGKFLKNTAREIGLGRFILMSQNEARNGGRERSSILADTLEAVIAALYLDGGMEAAKHFIYKYIIKHTDSLVEENNDFNYKSQLLEYTQANSLPAPEYAVVSEDGPDHEKHFEIEVGFGGKILGRGGGRSKKAAQQKAAQEAIKSLEI